LSEKYFRKGLKSLEILNYRDAILYFSKAYKVDPLSQYGELAYLYLGKSYSLYSYAFGSKKGVIASIGFLNQYPFYYKVPRFIHVQREFIADSYLLIQWYDTAKNIYANLYGETEKPEYMIKYSYAASLEGTVEGYTYLRELGLKGVPSDFLDLYYMTIAFYNFNLGKYKRAVEYITEALNLNPYLKEDANLLFRLGVSYYKLGNWRRALLYLELTVKNDSFKVYKERANFYLAFINLETGNYREAYRNLERLVEKENLFYSKLAQILFSSLWYYSDFLKVYRKNLGNYREQLLKLGWLNVEDSYGELPALGVYYFALESEKLTPEEEKFLRVKKIHLEEFILEGDLFSFKKFVYKLRNKLRELSYYNRKSASLIVRLYKVNPKNFLKVFGDQKSLELLARSLVFLGDGDAQKILPHLEDRGIQLFLKGKLYLIRNKLKDSLRILKEAQKFLKDRDRKEATLLIAYLKSDLPLMVRIAKEVNFEDPRFSSYAVPLYLRIADLLYTKGNITTAEEFYKKILHKADENSEEYWWALFRLAVIAETSRDQQTLKQVVKRAKEKDNIWSRVILTLWGS